MKREGRIIEAQKAQIAFFKRHLLPSALIFAYTFTYALPFLSAEAGSPGAIFDFGAGARPLAMGGAYSAMVKDASSLYYNPAGLSMMGNRNVSFMHAALFEGMSYDYLGYAQNYGGFPGGWGVQAIRLAAGTADGRDENNQPTGDFSYSESAFAAGTGVHGLFLPSLSLGASIKVLNRSMADETNRLIGFDIGARYGPVITDKLTLALVVRNFGSFAMGDTADKLPLGLKLGAAYALNSNISVCADVSAGGVFQFGAEYGMGPGAMRLGYDRNAFSFGGGLKFMKAYQLDYAMLKHPALGLSNRISLSYFFGGVAAPPKVRGYATDYIKKAEEAVKGRSYLEAHENARMSIGMDPAVRNGPWSEKYRRVEGVVAGLKLKELPARQELLKADTPQAVEAGRSIEAYLDGDNNKSVLLAHSALGYQPGDAFFSEFLQVMSGLTHSGINNDEILPRALLVNLKLEKAAAAFYAQDFNKTLKECSEALLLGDGNADVWKKLGSAYYALGDTAKARHAYGKVLELNPQDESIVRFMTLQGWK